MADETDKGVRKRTDKEAGSENTHAATETGDGGVAETTEQRELRLANELNESRGQARTLLEDMGFSDDRATALLAHLETREATDRAIAATTSVAQLDRVSRARAGGLVTLAGIDTRRRLL